MKRIASPTMVVAANNAHSVPVSGSSCLVLPNDARKNSIKPDNPPRTRRQIAAI